MRYTVSGDTKTTVSPVATTGYLKSTVFSFFSFTVRLGISSRMLTNFITAMMNATTMSKPVRIKQTQELRKDKCTKLY